MKSIYFKSAHILSLRDKKGFSGNGANLLI